MKNTLQNPDTTGDLAAQIAAEHEAAQTAARSAVEHARRTGELLIQAKAAIPHGSWQTWVAENLPFGERMARNYMRVARMLPELDAVKRQRVSDLSIRDALAEIAEPVRDLDRLSLTRLREIRARLRELWQGVFANPNPFAGCEAYIRGAGPLMDDLHRAFVVERREANEVLSDEEPTMKALKEIIRRSSVFGECFEIDNRAGYMLGAFVDKIMPEIDRTMARLEAGQRDDS